jgi:hypothetical protein
MSSETDLHINPITGDYIKTANGEWEEIEDGRTAVFIMLELELGASAYDPQDGTRIAAARRSGDPITPELLLAETERAAGLLVRDGAITDLRVAVRDSAGDLLVDQRGGPVVSVSYRDQTTGSPVDLAFDSR